MRTNVSLLRRLALVSLGAVLCFLAGCDGLAPRPTPPEVLAFSRGDRLDIENTALVNNNDAHFARRAFLSRGIVLP